MSRQGRIIFAFVLLAVLSVLLYEMLQSHEQVYQRKPLRVWLEQATAAGPMRPADAKDVEAVRQFGTNAIPTLLAMARAKDLPLKLDWIKLAQSLLRLHLHTDEEYHNMACFGFYALGAAGKDAVPSLVGLLKSDDPNIRSTACACLGNIGPSAKVAVPLLIQFLNDTNRFERYGAMISLGRIHMEPEMVVPILMENLNPTNANLSTTIFVLGEFGEEAKAAAPSILQYLNDKNDLVRNVATNVLKQIDPETAANAGIK